MSAFTEHIPKAGCWPVPPQEDVAISKERIWIDGCFDFAHHGHAGAMLQARRLGKELLVGIHSDEDILANKGPTVMDLRERVAAVDACRWSSKSIPHAPYVTSLSWISHYGCYYVAHGDDITSDSNGEDCYRYVKAAGRFAVVKRTPGISTTDLVGRMLLCTKGHFIRSLSNLLEGLEGSSDTEERQKTAAQMRIMLSDYATDETGLHPGCMVLSWSPAHGDTNNSKLSEGTPCKTLVEGKGPQPGQRVVYVDGGFDLFSSGHVEFLRQVVLQEIAIGQQNGWNGDSSRQYNPAYVVAGVHDDRVINEWKGLNYPIMNIFERGLCVLQCRYVDSVIFSAPYEPSATFLKRFPFGQPSAVYHGPTSFMPFDHDPYADARHLGIFKEIGQHEFSDVNAGKIVERILMSKQLYEARQLAKGEKATFEQSARAVEEAQKID